MSDLDARMKQFTDFRTVFLTAIISALTFVVGLFWNEAVKSAIEKIVPQGEGPSYKFMAAVIVTILVVIVVYLIIQSQRMAEERLVRMLKEQGKTPGKSGKAAVKKKGIFRNLF